MAKPGTLAQLGNAQRALAAASTLEDVLSIRDQAEALRVCIKAADKGLETANAASEIKLNAERKAGKMLKAMEKQKNQHGKSAGTTMGPASLEDLGISKNQSSRWQAEAKVPDVKFNAYLEDCKENKKEVTQAGLLKIATGAHVAANSGDNEWYTPDEYTDAARKVMGTIDLDPASSAVANKRVKAKKIFTQEQNGLGRQWVGNVWMNPPYEKQLIGLFVERLCDYFASGDVKQAAVLVNNATETRWFQLLAFHASAICFPAGRVKFWHPDKESAPLQGQAVIYLGNKAKTFCKEFSLFGFCVEVKR